MSGRGKTKTKKPPKAKRSTTGQRRYTVVRPGWIGGQIYDNPNTTGCLKVPAGLHQGDTFPCNSGELSKAEAKALPPLKLTSEDIEDFRRLEEDIAGRGLYNKEENMCPIYDSLVEILSRRSSPDPGSRGPNPNSPCNRPGNLAVVIACLSQYNSLTDGGTGNAQEFCIIGHTTSWIHSAIITFWESAVLKEAAIALWSLVGTLQSWRDGPVQSSTQEVRDDMLDNNLLEAAAMIIGKASYNATQAKTVAEEDEAREALRWGSHLITYILDWKGMESLFLNPDRVAGKELLHKLVESLLHFSHPGRQRKAKTKEGKKKQSLRADHAEDEFQFGMDILSTVCQMYNVGSYRQFNTLNTLFPAVKGRVAVDSLLINTVLAIIVHHPHDDNMFETGLHILSHVIPICSDSWQTLFSATIPFHGMKIEYQQKMAGVQHTFNTLKTFQQLVEERCGESRESAILAIGKGRHSICMGCGDDGGIADNRAYPCTYHSATFKRCQGCKSVVSFGEGKEKPQ